MGRLAGTAPTTDRRVASHRVAAERTGPGIAGRIRVETGQCLRGCESPGAAAREHAVERAVPEDNRLRIQRHDEVAQDAILDLREWPAPGADLLLAPVANRLPGAVPVAIQVNMMAVEASGGRVLYYILRGETPERAGHGDRKSTRLNSSHQLISY